MTTQPMARLYQNVANDLHVLANKVDAVWADAPTSLKTLGNAKHHACIVCAMRTWRNNVEAMVGKIGYDICDDGDGAIE